MLRWLLPCLLLAACQSARNKNVESVLITPEDKFFGNIITGHTGTGVRADTSFAELFDQVTAENFGKHGQVESERDRYNWGHLDTIYAYALKHNLIFKHHAFLFDHGNYALRPWLKELPAEEIRAEYEEWIRDYFARYPETKIVDVVNEALQSEVDPRIREALGGDDDNAWIKWTYRKARKYAPPGTVLLINEYAVLNDPERLPVYMNLAADLRDEGLIDGVGLQGHGMEELSAEVLKARLDTVATLGLPIHITEYDLDIEDDARQAAVMAEQFPVMWEHPSVAGITLWGYREGQTWKESTALLGEDGEGTEAWDWLVGYVGRRL